MFKRLFSLIFAGLVLVIFFPFISQGAINQSLSVGAQNGQVTELQQTLTTDGFYSGPITGYFGNLTKAAVIKFQISNGITPAVGFVGPLTMARVNAILSQQPVATNGANNPLQTQLDLLMKQVALLQARLQAQQGTTPPVPAPAPTPTSTPAPVPTPTPAPTTHASVTHNYDIVVVGAGTGGTAAAIQAARMGSRVALVEETDWVGGQMTAAAVTSMDGGGWGGSGIYDEFISRIRSYYQSRNKSIGTCYWSSGSNCFEPLVGQNILRQMLAEAASAKSTSALDIYMFTKVTQVSKNGNTVTGVVTENSDIFNAKVVIDATEHGDVIPLTGASYRLGNGVNGASDANSCVQDITYTAVIKKYPNGVPVGLFMATPPGPVDGPESYAVRKQEFAQIITLNGSSAFGQGYPYNFSVHSGYRGMPDSTNPEDYTGFQPDKITKTGVNWANDYPTRVGSSTAVMSTQYIQSAEYRTEANCKAKLKTLQFVYYAQHDLNQPLWSVANDEGYNGAYNAANLCDNIGPEFKTLESNMPVMPYVRESRRIIGLTTLVAKDIKRVMDASGLYGRPTTNIPTSVAVGDYGSDLHNCYADQNLETQLETKADAVSAAGPFEIPFGSFIPETVDGFVAAEKNISVSRLVGGAIRLQPVTINTGQAAGTIASLAAQANVQPRAVRPVLVQKVLLGANMKISDYYFTDVATSSPFWKAVQMVSAHGVMIGYPNATFGLSDALTRAQAAVVLAKMANLDVSNPPSSPTFEDVLPGSFGYPQVEAIYKAGITAGCSVNPKKYCPDSPATRGQFAVLFSVAMKFNTANVSQTPYFGDVPATSPWFHAVQYFYENGLTAGCSANPLLFCPDVNMTRGQTAAFIASSLWMP